MSTAPALHHLNAWERKHTAGSSLVIPTGSPALDDMLPGGGWPKAGLVEITLPDARTDAVTLVLPALLRLSRQGRWLAMVTPPYQPRVRILTAAGMNTSRLLQVNPHPGRSGLWTVESLLRAGSSSLVMAWPDCATELMEKNLKKAAVAGKATAILFRLARLSTHPSTADVRLRLEETDAGTVAYLLDGYGNRQSGIALA